MQKLFGKDLCPLLNGECAIAGIIKARMLMQNIIVPPQSFGGLQIRIIGHSHHKTFKMRMGRIDIAMNTSIKNFYDVVKVVILMSGHR